MFQGRGSVTTGQMVTEVSCVPPIAERALIIVDTGWSYGPPEDDNVFKIESIVMYYNTQETVGE